MTIFASSAAQFLLQAVTAHDTVIMRQVPPVRSWFEQVVFVASGISTLLVLVLIAGLVAAMVAVRRSVQRAHEALDRGAACSGGGGGAGAGGEGGGWGVGGGGACAPPACSRAAMNLAQQVVEVVH